MRHWLPVLLALGSLSGCQLWRDQSPSIELAITLSKSALAYREPVLVTVTVRNIHDREIILAEDPCDSSVEVLNAVGDRVWPVASGGLCVGRVVYTPLQPGETRQTRVVWAGQIPQANPNAPTVYVPPGRYRVRAVLKDPNTQRQQHSAFVEVNIQTPAGEA